MSAIILICGDLFDGVSETLSGHTGILIEGEKIGKIAPSVGRPMGAEVIDLSDHTVSPGFIDTHVHPGSLPISSRCVATRWPTSVRQRRWTSS